MFPSFLCWGTPQKTDGDKDIYICRIGASQDLGALEITKEWVKLRMFLVWWCGQSWRIWPEGVQEDAGWGLRCAVWNSAVENLSLHKLSASAPALKKTKLKGKILPAASVLLRQGHFSSSGSWQEPLNAKFYDLLQRKFESIFRPWVREKNR